MTMNHTLTRAVNSLGGETPVGAPGDCTYLAYWCENCERYSVWPGPDWGASHYFCDDCLTSMEIEQAKELGEWAPPED